MGEEMEKMLVTSIFSFSHNDFKSHSYGEGGGVKRWDCVVKSESPESGLREY